ncbi:MAG: hypothetical protein C0592_14570 [Marinilabiliales bacterium]|nr:MAG: hypothetical protein C0592_14570 [Marinilabiliales bacterium]
MKVLFLLVFLFSVVLNSFSQNDTIWTKCLGGSNDEVVGVFEKSQALVMPLPDSTFILVSNTYSNDGMMSSSHGSTDVFMAKMNYDGDTIWTKLIGGPDIDIPTGIDVDASGNIAICGYTYSVSGDFYGHHGDSTLGEPDGFIALYDINGNKTWAYQYGGTEASGIGGDDFLYDVHFMANGDLIATGTTSSINGDLNFVLDVYYCGWFLRVNSYGTVNKSSKVWGGDHDEYNSNDLFRIIALPNGKFVGYGQQWYFLTSNLWMVQFDSYGNIDWEEVYGPASGDAYACDFESTSTGGYIAMGYINGTGGDVGPTYNGGSSDTWVFTTDSAGTLIDDQCFGGSVGELAYRLQPVDNDFLLLGSSSSHDGYAPGDSLGYTEFWMVRFNEDLDTSFTMSFGGSNIDKLLSAMPIGNNELIVAGSTGSNDGWVHGNYGGEDIYVARLTTTPAFVHEFSTDGFLVYPNPAKSTIRCEMTLNNAEYEIFNYSGQLIEAGQTDGIINIESYDSGLYILRILDENSWWRSASFIKE